MKKQNLMIVSVFAGVLMLSLVSAGWFSNIFTGKAISDSQTVTLRTGSSATFDIGGETYRLTNLKQNGELSCFDWSSISSHERQNVCVGTKEKTIKINSQTFRVKRTTKKESFGGNSIGLEISLEDSQNSVKSPQELSPSKGRLVTRILPPKRTLLQRVLGIHPKEPAEEPVTPVEDHTLEHSNNGNSIGNLASGDFSGTGYAFACFNSAGKLFRSDIACNLIGSGTGSNCTSCWENCIDIKQHPTWKAQNMLDCSKTCSCKAYPNLVKLSNINELEGVTPDVINKAYKIILNGDPSKIDNLNTKGPWHDFWRAVKKILCWGDTDQGACMGDY